MLKVEITKERAVSAFGSQTKLAEALGISKAAVSKWPPGEPIPQKQALRLYYQIKPEAFRA